MREDKTLRQSLLFLSVTVLLLPLLLFSMVIQFRIWSLINRNMQEDIRQEVETSNQMLDMILDKYNTVLYDFCTDDDIIELVSKINKGEDAMNANSNRLRRELSHICNRNESVEGMTLVTEAGDIYFYDQNAASSVTSVWAANVAVPEVKQGTAYHGGASVLLGENEYGYLLQLSRRLVDYRNVSRRIGTVVLSINQDVIWDTIQRKDGSELFICENEHIIAARDRGRIRKEIDRISKDGRQVLQVVNDTTGWSIYNYYSTQEYNQALSSRMFFEIITMVGLFVFLIVLLLHIANPSLRQINTLAKAMEQVKHGDFSVCLRRPSGLPKEVVQIVDGFNSMVKRLGALVEQVKKSAVEQKNAELSAMEAQIDPHFLYNTLDTINWKAIEREEYDISNMVGALADILRYSIRNPGDTVTIRQELSWLGQYVMLQKEKLEQPLDLVVDVPEELMGYRIHKLMLQPFVENAINHGLSQMHEPCRLKIRMRLTEDQIYITIKDNGHGMSGEVLDLLNGTDQELKDHVGIANVKKRLRLYYGEDAALYFESGEGTGTKVHMFVKAIFGEDEDDEDSDNRG